MKSFKQYLNEGRRGTSLSDLLFLPRIGYYDQLMIPISSPKRSTGMKSPKATTGPERKSPGIKAHLMSLTK